MSQMGTFEMREHLVELLYESDENFATILSFNEAGVMTYNEGVVVRTDAGDEFQITIVRSAMGGDLPGMDAESDNPLEASIARLREEEAV